MKEKELKAWKTSHPKITHNFLPESSTAYSWKQVSDFLLKLHFKKMCFLSSFSSSFFAIFETKILFYFLHAAWTLQQQNWSMQIKGRHLIFTISLLPLDSIEPILQIRKSGSDGGRERHKHRHRVVLSLHYTVKVGNIISKDRHVNFGSF